MLALLLLPRLVGAPAPVPPDNPNGPPMSILIMPLHAEAVLTTTAHALDDMIF